ncbi:MFS general substrate transporter [Morchella conica CCBAS932]|uniref:MFS general substrate transporter n=1 Tax=Morchella conica CCBAS932 TaxID=1392247 RepID=A0A3N4L443_9PEZI|nr:MFS general substrate transporter [Morchella conica CCBAS932]
MTSQSSTVAENRLHASIQDQQSTTLNGGKYDGGVRPGKVPPVGAFEVSRTIRVVQVGVATIYCLLAAGVVFGYAALKPVMIKEGIYREHCTEHELAKNVHVCFEQEIRLNFMFTVAAVATNVCALLVGAILDQYGPRVSGMIGSVLFALGCLGFGFADKIHSYSVDPYPIAYFLLAVGGPFIFIPSFHLSNAFPTHSGLVLSMLTGAFDSSSAIFLLYRIVYEKTGGRVGLQEWFLGYLIVPAFIFVMQVLVMPVRSYKTVVELVRQVEVEEELLEEEDSDYEQDEVEVRIRRQHHESVIGEIDSLLGGKNAAEESERRREKRHEGSGVWGAMHGRPVTKQIASGWFVLIALFTIIQMTRINYFVATIRSQYEFLFHSYSKAVEINEFFDIALPVGGVLAVPFIGLILDSFSTLSVLSILVTMAAAIGALGLVERSYMAALAGIIGFVIYRPFYYTAVSDYTAKVFGFKTFGKIYGLVICLAGLFNFSQAGLDALTFKVFHKDPRPVNSGLLVAAVAIGIALVLYVWRTGRKIKRFRLGLEAERAEPTVMPGGSLNGYGGV